MRMLIESATSWPKSGGSRTIRLDGEDGTVGLEEVLIIAGYSA
jgi:hypothetical protein